MSRAPKGNDFGGNWTELKLNAINYYLKIYANALKDKPAPERRFRLWYIDAFAGTGTYRRKVENAPLLGDDSTEMDFAGSVMHALSVEPPFRHMVFIEKEGAKIQRLHEIAKQQADRNIRIMHGDANEQLRLLLNSPPWDRVRGGRGLERAVCFLDPFGMTVEWETLKLLASTRAIDVWYLFSLAGLIRQMARKGSGMDDSKRRAVNRVLGTETWEEDIYTADSPDLFGYSRGKRRMMTSRGIEIYVRDRLGDIFEYVSEPLPLLQQQRKGAQLFSLFCMSNNANADARALVKKFVRETLKKYGQASH